MLLTDHSIIQTCLHLHWKSLNRRSCTVWQLLSIEHLKCTVYCKVQTTTATVPHCHTPTPYHSNTHTCNDAITLHIAQTVKCAPNCAPCTPSCNTPKPYAWLPTCKDVTNVLWLQEWRKNNLLMKNMASEGELLSYNFYINSINHSWFAIIQLLHKQHIANHRVTTNCKQIQQGSKPWSIHSFPYLALSIALSPCSA